MTRYEQFNEMIFEACCKKSIGNAINKARQKKAARAQIEQPLSTLTDTNLYALSKEDKSVDWLEEPCHIFQIQGLNFPVYDQKLSCALSHLLPKDREIVLLHFFSELTDIKIAPLLHISRSTVARRRKAAMERLRELMENPA